MSPRWKKTSIIGAAALVATALLGCRNHMPHAFTWPGGGDITQSHAKPPEGGYYSNWDPYAVELDVVPLEDVNPVMTQHVLIATVRDKDGKPLPNRRVEWIVNEGSIGDIVEVDESGWRNSRGYKVGNNYAVSHTNNFDHVLDLGDDDPSNDISLETGQTWCVITSPVEGTTYMTVYAPGIYDWSKHKVFVKKHWYDVRWEFPPEATNPTGTTHDFVTQVHKYSDGSPLPGYTVDYRIVDGPDAVFAESGGKTASVQTDASGLAKVTIRQTTPMEGTNHVEIDINRPANEACCEPAVHIATGQTAKTWIGPKIACDKTAPANVLAGQEFTYTINVSNPSQVAANNVVVTDNLPSGIEYISSSPSSDGAAPSLRWSLGSIDGGASRSISIQVRATRTGQFENCAEVVADQNLSSRCCATTVATSPALALEKQCPSQVTICDPIEYTLIVRNTGDGTATNVQIVDELPDGIVSEDGSRTIQVNAGTLEPGQAKQARFTVTAQRTGTFVNRATATGDNGLTASAECTTTVTQPVLSVTKQGPGMRYLGRPAEYTITVSNTGDAPANQTVLTDDVPAGTQFVSASDGGSMSGNMITWNLGTLEPGASRSVTMTVKAVQAGTIRNTATARAICAEATASAEMMVEGVPAILLEVVDLADPIEIGANETYVITVTNQGTAPDTNIRIEATLPPEQEYVSSDGLVQASVDGPKVVFAPLPSLAPKQKAEYRVVVRGVSAGDVRFKISLTSDQTTSPVEETESTHQY